MVYKWETNLYKIDANIVGEQLEKLEKENGEITRQSIVDMARKKSNPMHDMFEWDDTIAAEKYRYHQAGRILTNLKIVIDENAEQVSRAWVNIRKNTPISTGVYVNVKDAMSDEDRRSTVFENALRELELFKRKYESLQEFKTLFSEIDRLTGKSA